MYQRSKTFDLGLGKSMFDVRSFLVRVLTRRAKGLVTSKFRFRQSLLMLFVLGRFDVRRKIEVHEFGQIRQVRSSEFLGSTLIWTTN